MLGRCKTSAEESDHLILRDTRNKNKQGGPATLRSKTKVVAQAVAAVSAVVGTLVL